MIKTILKAIIFNFTNVLIIIIMWVKIKQSILYGLIVMRSSIPKL